MKLRYSPASPFVRKVRMAAALLGLDGKIELVAADTNDPSDSLRQQNPLGKLPVLMLDDGTTIYDSLIIVSYLDSLANGPALIPEGPERWEVLTTHSLADGMCEAALMRVYEKRYRPEEIWHEPWLEHQTGKIDRALDALEAKLPPLSPTIRLDAVAVAAALGYLDLRFPGSWRDAHPKLEAWLDRFAAAVPAFAETAPPD